MVAVPEVGNDPSQYADLILAAGYFEAVTFSADDRLRATSYVLDKERVSLQQTLSVDDYLASLKMRIVMSPIDEASRQRVTQLVNKTNQFNLTTRRYTEAEIRALENSKCVLTIQARLADQFGDLGLIAVIIGREQIVGSVRQLRIETWLMSCRVLGRRVEEVMLLCLVQRAKERNIRLLEGQFLPTSKNKMVADMYSRLGFDLVGARDGEPGEFYSLDLERYQAPDVSSFFEICEVSVTPDSVDTIPSSSA